LKLLVAGGRNYDDAARVDAELRRYIEPGDLRSIVITGAAAGADLLAASWCFKHGVHIAQVPALWYRYGSVAGPIRNRAMLLLVPDLLLAFPGGKGTANVIREAKEAGIAVTELR
jgi:hypothetical protein